MIKKLFIFSLISFVFIFLNLNSNAQTLTLKFSHVVADDTPKGQAALLFAKKAKEYTNGRVEIKVYPNSILYKDNEEIEALRLGSVDFLAPSVSKFGPLGLSQFEVFDLPYIFAGYGDVHKITHGPVGKKLLDLFATKGIQGLAYWDTGFKSFSANSPINLPSDLKGKKLRIQSSKILEAQMRALGAIPQIMAFSEVYNALQTGVVDGTENPITNIYTQKFYEVQKYLTLTQHGYLGSAVIANKKFWDGLPADIRGSLLKAMDEATDFANKLSQEKAESDLKAIIATGKTTVRTPTATELAAFKKALIPVHKEMASRIGKSTLDDFYKELDFKE